MASSTAAPQLTVKTDKLMTQHPRTYQEGLLEGRLQAYSDILTKHEERLNSHSRRLRSMERVVWGVMGATVFIQVWPMFATFIEVARSSQ